MRTINFSEFINQISSNPTSIIAILGVLILIIGFIKIRKVKISTKIIAQVGLALALSAVLQIFRIYHFPQGGSVTLGSMLPIIIIALVYGPEIGFLTGFLHGMLTLILDPYILHPVQFLFDYPLPSMALGLAGYFRNNKIIASIVAIFTKFVFHFISGFVFFGSYAPKNVSPIIYSLTVNGTLMLVEGTICIILITILPVKLFAKHLNENYTS